MLKHSVVGCPFSFSIHDNSFYSLQENLGKFADSGEKFEVFAHISKVTLDIIMRCAFSYHTDVQREEG